MFSNITEANMSQLFFNFCYFPFKNLHKNKITDLKDTEKLENNRMQGNRIS